MLLPDKVYDVLKNISIYVMPSIATAVFIIGTALGWEYAVTAQIIINAAATCLAGCIGMSVSAYKKAVAEQQDSGGDDETPGVYR